jgi:hypothetical protein
MIRLSHSVYAISKDDPRRTLLVSMAKAFLDQPTLRLTLSQAQRLWNLDNQTCREHLSVLTGARFLELRDSCYQLPLDAQA